MSKYELSIIPITDPQFRIIKINPTKPKIGKVNHIVLFNNAFGESYFISNQYARMLDKYSHFVDIPNIHLITSYPNIKTTSFGIDQIYTNFKKIINNKTNTHSSDEMENMLKECKNVLSNDIPNEVVIISTTTCLHGLVELLDEIANTMNTNIVLLNINKSCHSNQTNNECDKILTFTCEEDKDINIFFEGIISNGIFLSQNINVVDNVQITLNNATLLCEDNIDTFKINVNQYNSFLIKFNGADNNIKLNIEYGDEKIETELFNNTELNKIDMVNAFLHTIEYMNDLITDNKSINPNISILIKDKTLQLINNNQENKEVINKSIYLYSLIKDNSHHLNLAYFTNEQKTPISDNTKMVLDYGKKIYENNGSDKKMFKLNDRISKNIVFINKLNNIKDILGTDTNKKFIEVYDDTDNLNFNNSCDYFNSPITLSNWYEEFKIGSAIGLLIKIKINNLVKLGVSKNVKFENITSTFYPVTDYITCTNEYFEKKQGMSNNQQSNNQQSNNQKNNKFGNLNDKIVLSGTSIGDSNAVIPLYINKYHWQIAKQYINPILGIIFAHNPFGYCNKHKSFMFSVFAIMTTKIFTDTSCINHKWLNSYIAYLRTCTEICFENKYQNGIRRLIENFVKNPSNRIVTDVFYDDVFISQTLSTGYILSDDMIKMLIHYIIEESARHQLKTDKMDMQYLEYLKTMFEIDNVDKLKNEIDDTINKLFNNMNYHLVVIVSFYKMNKILNNFYKLFGSFNKFLKSIETGFGLVDESYINNLIKDINDNKFSINSFKDIYDIIGLKYHHNNFIIMILQNIAQSNNTTRMNNITTKQYWNYMEHLEIESGDDAIIDIIKNVVIPEDNKPEDNQNNINHDDSSKVHNQDDENRIHTEDK